MIRKKRRFHPTYFIQEYRLKILGMMIGYSEILQTNGPQLNLLNIMDALTMFVEKKN